MTNTRFTGSAALPLSQASPQAMGALVVTHLVTTFNLEFALLLTERDVYLHAHTRNLVPAAALEQITGHARSLRATPAAIQPIAEVVAGVPLLLLPLGNGRRAGAVLCCGPKHSGDRYTPQDHTLLHALGHYLAVRLDLQAQLDAQGGLLVLPREAAAQTALMPLSGAAVVVPLTRRELMVLHLLAQGMGNKEIAAHLEQDADTVEKHVRNIRRKLGVQASSEAVVLARQQGLLPLE